MVMAADRTHYDTLGIDPSADADEIRRAWKVLVQVWHPDRFTGDMRDEAESRAAQINGAYQALRDSSKRAAYDCRLAADREQERERTTTSAKPRTRPRAAATPRFTNRPNVARSMPFQHAEPVATPPQSLGEVALDMIRELITLVRRSPRFVGGSLALLTAMLAVAFAMSLTGGPSTLPSHGDLVRGGDTQAQAAPDPLSQAQMDAAVADLDAAAQRRADEQAAAAQQAQTARTPEPEFPAAQPVLRVPQASPRGNKSQAAPPHQPRVLRIMPRK